jgi:hypothetical protein
MEILCNLWGGRSYDQVGGTTMNAIELETISRVYRGEPTLPRLTIEFRCCLLFLALGQDADQAQARARGSVAGWLKHRLLVDRGNGWFGLGRAQEAPSRTA